MRRSRSMGGQSRLRFPVHLAATAAFAVLGLTGGALGQTFVVTGTPTTTVFSGNGGGDTTREKNADDQRQAMHAIGGKEQSDDPCDLLLFYQDFTSHAADQALR